MDTLPSTRTVVLKVTNYCRSRSHGGRVENWDDCGHGVLLLILNDPQYSVMIAAVQSEHQPFQLYARMK